MKCRYFCRLPLDISPVYLTRGISIVISGFFSMFGILGQVTIGLLVLVIGIIWILCIGIFTHSCLYLRKNQTSVKEEKRLTRDAFIKALFFTCITVLYFSIFEFAQICNIRSLIMFFCHDWNTFSVDFDYDYFLFEKERN